MTLRNVLFFMLCVLMKNCATKGKIVGAVRILLGLALLAFGVMKLGANTEMMGMVGGAGAAMGLDFLSATTRFWIAVIGEILAGVLLLTGCKKLSKIGAILALIIMVFAINAVGFNLNAILVTLGALIVLILGPGCFGVCKGKCCKGDSCKGGTCNISGKDMTTAASGVVAKAGDVVEDVVDKVEDVVEKVGDKVEDIVEGDDEQE